MTKYYKAHIIEVLPGSVAQNHHIEPGDSLLFIDNTPVRDLLDYQFLIYDTKSIIVGIEKTDGSVLEIDIKKQPNEDLGLIFESAVFDRVKPCTNKCVFCFVDQQPDGLRDSLYIKDDDYRLSYLQGTYITLTNLTKEDKQRIEQLRLGPLYVSVHTTNPGLRSIMLCNPKASDIMEQLSWLNSLFIPVHTQIVLCPGINDGVELQRTLHDLSKLDNVHSVAIVPVGITIYRDGDILKPLTKKIAEETIRLANEINKEKGFYFAFPSDEIFVLADQPIPDEVFYSDFPQLEDGVGSIRLAIKNFESLKLPEKLDNPRHIGILTGSLAYGALAPVWKRFAKIENLKLDVIEIKSHFWGDKVTVAGLVVGEDIINSLQKYDKLPPEIFIPGVMLRKFTNQFIDGITVEDIEQKFGVKILVMEDYYSFKNLVELL